MFAALLLVAMVQVLHVGTDAPVFTERHTIKSTAAEAELAQGRQVVCINRGHPNRRNAYVCLTEQEWQDVMVSAERLEQRWDHVSRTRALAGN